MKEYDSHEVKVLHGIGKQAALLDYISLKKNGLRKNIRMGLRLVADALCVLFTLSGC